VQLFNNKPAVAEVFPAVGKPVYTYIERGSGVNERKLSQGLSNPGQICLVTGPSKTGKTSLYRSVLPSLRRQELIIRCSGSLNSAQFWASALESLNFQRLAESAEKWGINTTAKIGAQGEVGWSWLAKVMATVGFEVSSSGEYSIRKEVANSNLGSKHLIPLLKELPIQLVVEDFHYLEPLVKKEIFQQWKAFIDEGVSVVVVSTTHHAIDIARANSDLSGRTRFIDVGKWEVDDLAKIPATGFRLLDIKATSLVFDQIAKESVGLPIITQQISQEIASRRNMNPGSKKRLSNVQIDEVREAQEYVAENLYANHKGDYDQLSTGPRKSTRKHATYEKILASFALEPLQFSLKYHELIERVNRLKEDGDDNIPAASMTAALRALAKFQERNKIALLDWHEMERTLYIVEPSFLFYLRQKIDRRATDLDIERTLIRFFKSMENNGAQLELTIKMPK
jgi:hypothetical protein